MKHLFWNVLAVLAVIVLGSIMFVLKYQVIEKEKELARIHRQISADKREIHMLNADWALLNDPERLRALVEQQTQFKIIKAQQVITLDDIPYRKPSVPGQKPNLGEL